MGVGDFASNFKAKKAEEQSGQALHRADEVVDQLRDLRREFERLQMICEGMWTILKEKTGATEAQLLELIEEIDLRDGKLDGRSTKPAVKCARCQRVVSVRTSVCLYCGAMNERTTVF
jgi:hypothetical protein